MISKSQYINKLRELNYTFKRQAPRADLWRKRGGTHYIPPFRRMTNSKTNS